MTENISPLPRYTVTSLIVGVAFVIICLLFILFNPCPTGPQFLFFRILISIGVSGFSAIIPGFLNIKYKEQITAGGALAVLVLVFLFNPATLVIQDDCQSTKVKGRVLINGESKEMVQVTLLESEITRTTNQLGVFELSIPSHLVKDTLTFIIHFKSIDTTFFKYPGDNLEGLEFKIENRHVAPIIESMEDLSSWSIFPDSLGSEILKYDLVQGTRGNCLRIEADIRHQGWVIAEKATSALGLADKNSIDFYCKKDGDIKTIEIKLIYGDIKETTYGILIPLEDNQDIWKKIEFPISMFDCWWPEEYCNLYKGDLSLSKVRKVQFVLSNNDISNDAVKGAVLFDELSFY